MTLTMMTEFFLSLSPCPCPWLHNAYAKYEVVSVCSTLLPLNQSVAVDVVTPVSLLHAAAAAKFCARDQHTLRHFDRVMYDVVTLEPDVMCNSFVSSADNRKLAQIFTSSNGGTGETSHISQNVCISSLLLSSPIFTIRKNQIHFYRSPAADRRRSFVAAVKIEK